MESKICFSVKTSWRAARNHRSQQDPHICGKVKKEKKEGSVMKKWALTFDVFMLYTETYEFGFVMYPSPLNWVIFV